jgi:hypothetical protein
LVFSSNGDAHEALDHLRSLDRRVCSLHQVGMKPAQQWARQTTIRYRVGDKFVLQWKTRS